MDFQSIRESIITLVPDTFVDARATQDFCRMPQHEDEQSIFLGGQVEPLAISLDPLCR